MDDRTLNEYRRTRDPALIHERDSQKALRFTMNPLSPTFVAFALDEHATNETRRLWIGFAASCRRIRLRDGTVMEPPAGQLIDSWDGQRVAPNSWVNEVAKRVGMNRIIEVGAVIVNRVRLGDEDLRPTDSSSG